MVEVFESEFNSALDEVVSDLVGDGLCTLLVGLFDCFGSDARTSVHDNFLSLGHEPVHVHPLVGVKHAFLSISQLVVWNQIEVLLQSLGIVNDISISICVIFFEVLIYFSLQLSHCIEFLTLIFEMVETAVLRLLENNKFISLLVDIGLVAETKLQSLIL